MSVDLPTIRVEFYGVPRIRAGVVDTPVQVPLHTTTLGEILNTLASRFPNLAAECFAGKALREGFAANVGGERFVRRPEDILTAGETLLIFSSDAGG